MLGTHAQLRTLEERLRDPRELEERRTAILESVREQGKLTEEVEAQIRGAETKARLEDIHPPVQAEAAHEGADRARGGPGAAGRGPARRPVGRPARRGDGVRRRGQGRRRPAGRAGRRPVDPHGAVLGGRRPDRRAARTHVGARGRLAAKVREGKAGGGRRVADYFDFAEPFKDLPSHRVLAMLRGEKEEVLDLVLEPEEPSEQPGPSSYEGIVAHHFQIAIRGRPGDKWLTDTVRWAWRTRILVHLGIDLRLRLRTAAEDEAVNVFAANLRDLLLAAPAGTRATLGLDPGFRTGVKVAVVDATGKVVATDVIYPHVPANKWDEAIAKLARLAKEHAVELIAIGNGTASRETDSLPANSSPSTRSWTSPR